MNYFILPFFLLSLVSSLDYGQKCTCSQLIFQTDCSNNSTCKWDPITSKCSTQSSITNQIKGVSWYCGLLTATECPNKLGCAYFKNACTFFTGCTIYQFSTTAECQAVSSKCITDGVGCVDKGACSTYLTQTSCLINYDTNRYCYWDGQKCSDADTCAKLPSLLDTDAKCRTQLSTCVTNRKGCVESGTSCSDQKYDYQCLTNKTQSQKCFWRDNQCFDMICSNASLLLTTHETCNTFLQTCTVNSEGKGCVSLKPSCYDYLYKDGCVQSSTGSECYWNGQKCVELSCQAIVTTVQSNAECAQIKKGCITKSSGGCVENVSCSSADVEKACQIDSKGQDCYWNSSIKECRERKCNQAPASYTTFEECTKFLSTCTLNSPSGCIDRTCENAPTSLKTISECSLFIVGGKCIPKKDGGCMKIDLCSTIQIKEVCTKDINDNECYWDGTQCKEKICLNAPSTAINDESCSNFYDKCIYGTSGCVDKLCSAIKNQNDCKQNYLGQPCNWNSGCFKKTCENASINLTSHQQCNDYLKSCTVNNDEKGCMELPILCESLKQYQCYLNSSGKECGWDGKQCLIKQCVTAYPITAYTNSNACNNYINGCVVQSSGLGCMAMPDDCESRHEIICEYQNTKCKLVNSKCVNRICTLAVGNTYSSNLLCQAFKKECIVNSTQNGCVDKAKYCSQLVQIQCTNLSSQEGDCFWNGLSCVGKLCKYASESLKSHSDCQAWNKACTFITLTSNKCTEYESDCFVYGQSQCVKTISGQKCKWNTILNLCQPQQCSEAIASSQELCQQFMPQCSINNNKNGCVSIKDNCTSYNIQNECGWSKIDGRCYWDSNKCIKATCIKVEQPSSLTAENCEQLNLDCTYISGSTCSSKICSNKNGKSQQECQNWMSSCSINNGSNQCVIMKSKCSDYSQSDCGWSQEGRCYINNSSCYKVGQCNNISLTQYTQSNCQSVSDFKCTLAGRCVERLCSLAITKTSFTQCQSFSNKCSINASNNDCVTIQSTCTQYSTANTCAQSIEGRCEWNTLANKGNGACQDANCSSATTKTSQKDCQSYSIKCSINNLENDCVTMLQTCDLYTIQNQCGYSQNGKCKWSNNKCINVVCSDAPNKSAQLFCQLFSTGCVINSTKNDCHIRQDKCSSYTTISTCTYSLEGQCVWDSNANFNNGACQDIDCATISNAKTFEQCQAYSTKCSIDSTYSKCIKIQDYCISYNQSDCSHSQFDRECLWNGNACVKATCANASATFTQINDTACQSISSIQCNFEADTLCSERKCNGPYGPQSVTSFEDCQKWLSTCSINTLLNKCIDILDDCTYSIQTDCYWSSKHGRCQWIKNTCTRATCSTVMLQSFSEYYCQQLTDLNCTYGTGDNKCSDKECNGKYGPSNSINKYDQCQSWSKNCSINKKNDQCIPIAIECKYYQTENDCYQSQQSRCTFDQITKSCRNTLCSDANLTQSNQLLCNDFLNTCTSIKVGGCMDLQLNCSDYSQQAQCVQSTTQKCYWSKLQSKCKDLNCLNFDASDDFSTAFQCSYALNTCTIREQGGVKVKGCQTKGTCDTFHLIDQCDLDINNVKCAWTDDNKCLMKTCSTASSTYSTHDLCYQYLDKQCTLSNTGRGCTNLSVCESYQLQSQCVLDLNLNRCQWDSGSSICQTISCSNAPSNVKSTQDCEAHLPICTYSTNSCKSMYCEDFQYNTDEKCQSALSNNKCTSDGTKCVIRTTCDLTKYQISCTIDINNNQCAWMNTYCTVKSCLTAPTTLTSESECNNYYSGCTTKIGGGCMVRGYCSQSNVKEGCIKGIDNKVCTWDDNEKKCRNQICEDISGTSFTSCQQISSDCTLDGTGKCQTIKSCSLYVNENSCYLGIEGPCLWIDKNCYAYTSCTSLNWTTDNQCKKISDNCTTNGTNCLALKKCKQTNVNGGCIIGTDGLCILINNKCSFYQECNQAYYLTHQLCQNANKQCTTNTISGCIHLNECSSYLYEENCKINQSGKITDTNNKITSTGNCVWENKSCRDQVCSDLTGLTHSECNNKLSTCTFNSVQCITMGKCESYTAQLVCQSAQGTDGICVWEIQSSVSSICRVLSCSDIRNGINTPFCRSQLNSCVSDGTKCISKSLCSDYTTRIGCESDGTDGVCIWNSDLNKCSNMNDCNSASIDQRACKRYSDACAWISKDNVGQCVNLTCSQQYQISGQCIYFNNFDRKSFNICVLSNQQCIQIDDPLTISAQYCYIQTQGQFYWDTSCKSCQIISTNVTNNTQIDTQSEYIVSLLIILLYINIL